MATAPVTPLVSIDEYLHMSFEYDAEYVDGHIEERPVPEFDHAQLQIFIGGLLLRHKKSWGVRIAGDARIQTTPMRFRLPDLCITRASEPKEQVLRTPPLLCIEILSPEDRPSRIQRKCEEFLMMGVLAVWVLNTRDRLIRVYTASATTDHRDGLVTVPGTPIQLDVLEAFSTLDE